MTARPPVANVCQVVHNWEVGDKAAANVMHYQYSPGGNAPLTYVEALAAACADGMAGQVGLWGEDSVYLGATATDLNSDTGFSATSPFDLTGTRDNAALPGNVALLASYGVARRFRGGHPRTYLPWFTISDVDSPQTWVGASVSAATTAFGDALGEALTAVGGGYSTVAQVMVSYVLADHPRVTPLVNQIVFTHCDILIASQRRRDGRH